MTNRLSERLAFVVLLLVSLAPNVAFATRIVPVVRPVGAGSDKAAAFIGYYTRYYLTEDGRYDVVEVNSALGGSDVDQALKAFSEADELVQKASAAYETLDLDPAVEYLANAVSRYEKHAANLIDVKEVASALMLLGAVHILRGEEKTGTDRLAQSVSLYPSVEPDPKIFNPSMRQLFQRTHDLVVGATKGSLSVTSNPNYAELYVDGVFRGVTPTAVPQLSPGRHYVRLVKDGYRPWGDVVNVVSNREVSHNGVLKPLKRFEEFDRAAASTFNTMRSRADSSDDSLDGSATKLQQLLGADHLFAIEVKVDGDHVKLIAAQLDLRAGKRIKVVPHSFSYDARLEVFDREVGALLRTQFGETTLGKKIEPRSSGKDGVKVGRVDDSDGDGPVDAVSTGSGGPCFGLSCATFKTAALISAAGGGGGLAVIGSVLYLLAYRDNRDYRDSAIQNSTQAAQLRSSGKTKALIGDILVPLGLAVAGAGTALYLFYEPPGTSTAALDFSFDVGGGGASVFAGTRF